MTKQEVLTAHQKIFYAALIDGDWDALSDLYADDYTLVRSNGVQLSKQDVLLDLRSGGLIFKAIEMRNELVRLSGSMALLTGESTTLSEQNGVEFRSQFRFTAVYVQSGSRMHLLHFQSTDIAKG
jgi:ketosteroid isomerase-like protein